MKKLLFTSLLIGVSLLYNPSLFGQRELVVNYTINKVDYSTISQTKTPQIEADEFKSFEIDISTLLTQLKGVKTTFNDENGFVAKMKLPHPNGDIHDYDVVENTTMSEGLQKKYPNIRSYDAYSSVSGNKVKLDITNDGLRAMIITPNDGVYFIDPIFNGNTTYYMVYRKSDFNSTKIKECLFEGDDKDKSGTSLGSTKSFVTCELRTYDVAISATVEYSNFHGGTVADALSAQVTTMNRVNGVFERDLAVTMSLVPNNDQIIFTGDPASDPFTNGNPGNMINENQTVCDNNIGSENYDIGHVFGTNSGGLAGLGVICVGGQKARGVTGSGAPIGDPFDIDYVAHEMGHQYGANHTQNNGCNRNNATAMEPGSASTIMGYAGICAPNVQNNSDDHFHGISLEEMSNRILSSGCATISAIANNAPVIQSTNGNITVPAATPFALTANTTDADGDILQYCWEQMDNEITNQPPEGTATGGPNFRSNSPVNNPTRYFPNLIDLAAGGPFTWEVVPTVSRTMDFRVTVRDKPLGVAGCNDFEDVTVTTDVGSGPFIVTYPSATGIIWDASTTETVTWDVANTDVAPVSCTDVDVYLSTDGGITYTTLLADDVPNTGSANITVPNIGTTTARIMVVSSTGTFFDISDNNFEISPLSFDYTLAVNPSLVEVCQPSAADYTIDIGSVDGYNDPVSLTLTGLPAGATSSFSTNPVTPVGTSTLTIDDTDFVTPGTYSLNIEANSTSGAKNQEVTLTILDNNPTSVNLISPVDGESEVSINPTLFDWSAASGNGVTYDIQIAADNSFTNIIDESTGVGTSSYSSNSLNQGTLYFWRIRYTNACANSDWSTIFSFTTSNCADYLSTDVPVIIPNNGTVTSTIVVPPSGNITDVNISNISGTHTRTEQLTFTLTSPQGTTVSLMDQVCTNFTTDFNIGFDDEAVSATVPCPPSDGNAYQPSGILADFVGEDPAGAWTLTIIDNSNPQGGELQSWSIEICSEIICNDSDTPTASGNETICTGETTNLSITNGGLNNATNWQWYTGSCGETSVGSGSSLSVSPNTTTTYYVRGEGGCTNPSACDEVTIFVSPTFTETQTASICDGDIYTFGTQSLTTAGSYVETFASIDGCDSTVTLNLNVNSTYTETEETAICNGQNYSFGGQSLTASGTYTETFTSLDGCDSTVVLTLTVVNQFNENDEVGICEGETYVFGAQSLTSSGFYTETFTSTGGCDSIVNLNLSVHQPYSEQVNATICDGETYTFPDGTTSTIEQTQTSTLTSVNGCDSIIVTNLDVQAIDASVLEEGSTLTATQENATYQWIDCDNNEILTGETAASFTAQTTGDYAVIITLNNCSDTSDCHRVDLTDLNTFKPENLIVYPNPTNGMIKLEWSGKVNQIEVFDAIGRQIIQTNNLLEHGTTLNVSKVEKGVYYIKVHHSGGVHNVEIIKQ